MRIVESVVGDIRRKVFSEVARMAFEGGNYSRLEDLPYRIVPGEAAIYRESIFLERAVVAERLRLAIGLPLRTMDKHAPVSKDIEESAIDHKYYDPPLLNVIKFACNACRDEVVVSNLCQGCIARPCLEICPKDAIGFIKHHAVIDQNKCVKCGKCRDVCSYNAIVRLERHCAKACGVDAVNFDEDGRAVIDQDKCVACGMCIVNCPFGAISDKGQIFQLIHAIKQQENMIALVAPSFIGQFPQTTPEQFSSALKKLGFSKVVEVAVGADLCAIEDAKEFLKSVPNEMPFMATSCCPSWSVMAKRQFPEFEHCISMALTPMVLMARLQKKEAPDCKIVFIGPCAAKKLEASRRAVRSDVDFVITFEELLGMFEAKGIKIEEMESDAPMREATAAGRGFAVTGGVARSVVDVIKKLEPQREIKTEYANGLKECRNMLIRAKAGKYNGYLLEGMACPGGCIAGTGTMHPADKTAPQCAKYSAGAEQKNALDSKHAGVLDVLVELYDN